MDPVCKAIVETMEAAGIAVTIAEDHAEFTVTARTEDGHTHVIHGDDLYTTATEAGIDLADG